MQTWLRLIAATAALAVSGCIVPPVTGTGTTAPKTHGSVAASVKHYAKKHNVPVALALNIAQIESNFRCSARSSVGAIGPMQVMPGTAAKHGFSRKSLRNCNTAIEAGIMELRYCLTLTANDYRRTVACYNAGPGSLRWRKLPLETRNYQRKLKVM